LVASAGVSPSQRGTHTSGLQRTNIKGAIFVKNLPFN
jgi:hypothetical protein